MVKWTRLSAVFSHLSEVYEVPALARIALVKPLRADRLRWRSEGEMQGYKRPCDPGCGDPAFWETHEFNPRHHRGKIQVLCPDLARSYVRRRSPGLYDYAFGQIELLSADVQAVWPGFAASTDAPEPKAKPWRKQRPTKAELKATLSEIDKDHLDGELAPPFDETWDRVRSVHPAVTRRDMKAVLANFPRLRRPPGRQKLIKK
jgi:hypothetical protein